MKIATKDSSKPTVKKYHYKIGEEMRQTAIVVAEDSIAEDSIRIYCYQGQ